MVNQHRTQALLSYTQQQKRNKAIAIVVLLMITAGLLFFLGINRTYHPPKYDSQAKLGTPEPEDSYLYQTLSSDFGYQFAFAANLYQQEDSSLNIYFTNPANNTVNLMCEISSDATGKTLYKSGVVQPGEYIETLPPIGSFENEATMVTITFYAFEPDSWYSAGSTELSTMLQAW